MDPEFLLEIGMVVLPPFVKKMKLQELRNLRSWVQDVLSLGFVVHLLQPELIFMEGEFFEVRKTQRVVRAGVSVASVCILSKGFQTKHWIWRL